MQNRTRGILALGLVAALLLAGFAWAASDEDGVRVEQAYFVTASPEGQTLNLTAQLFLSNRGALASDPVALTVFVVPNDSGLSTYRQRVVVGAVEPGATTEASVPIRIPDFNATRSYRIDFLLFEDGLLTQKGSGAVGWGGGWHGSYDLALEGTASRGLSVSAPSFEDVR